MEQACWLEAPAPGTHNMWNVLKSAQNITTNLTAAAHQLLEEEDQAGEVRWLCSCRAAGLAVLCFTLLCTRRTSSGVAAMLEGEAGESPPGVHY